MKRINISFINLKNQKTAFLFFNLKSYDTVAYNALLNAVTFWILIYYYDYLFLTSSILALSAKSTIFFVVLRICLI